MTHLDGTQVLVGGQLMWLNTEFSVDGATSPGLGSGDGGRVYGSNGYVPAGGAFLSTPRVARSRVGFRRRGQLWLRAGLRRRLGRSLPCAGRRPRRCPAAPSIAYRVNDKLSLGAGINGMYGMFDQKVAINNAVPSLGDGRLELDDDTWGAGAPTSACCTNRCRARAWGSTYTSEIDLDFSSTAKFSGIGPTRPRSCSRAACSMRRVDVGAKVPQQVMASVYTEIDQRWALLGNVGRQDWSEFGEVEIGIDNTQDPISLTSPLSFDDTWHIAVGAQYRPNDQWKVNVGLAYDSGFQDNDDVPPLFPVNSAWRLGAGGERQVSESFKWGFTTALLYGGDMDVDKRSTLPPVLGGAAIWWARTISRWQSCRPCTAPGPYEASRYRERNCI